MERIRNIDALRPWVLGACGLLTITIVFFSWLPKPQLSAQIPMPGMVAVWVDAAANENLRTAVPFLLLGLFAGLLLWMRGAELQTWLLAWRAMVTLAAMAELGQCLIPERCCDVADVGWAAVGSAAGLFMTPLATRAWRLQRGLREES